MITLNGNKIHPTRFPDKTTQVWKVEGLEANEYNVVWSFENDGELISVLQLCQLLRFNGKLSLEGNESGGDAKKITLYIPFLPYARQDKGNTIDKVIDLNQVTFGLHTIANVLATCLFGVEIIVVDIHSDEIFNIMQNYPKTFISIQNTYPVSLVREVNTYDAIIFPDAGAAKRYSKLFSRLIPKYIMRKTRNQVTGEITGMEFVDDTPELHSNIVIVDDICDGGRTFIGAADCIHDAISRSIDADVEPITTNVDLCITHGIFSNYSLLVDMFEKCFNKIITTDTLYPDFDFSVASKQSHMYKYLKKRMDAGRFVILDTKELQDFTL